MPRKSAATPAAARTATRAKAVPKAPARKAVAAKAPAAKTNVKPNVKTAVKSAARALAAPAPAPARAARKKVAPAPASAPARDAVRPVLVRDSFTMPEAEYAVLADVKSACLRAGVDVKKSELLRIGVALLGQVDIATLKAVLAALPQLKTGRPPAGE